MSLLRIITEFGRIQQYKRAEFEDHLITLVLPVEWWVGLRKETTEKYMLHKAFLESPPDTGLDYYTLQSEGIKFMIKKAGIYNTDTKEFYQFLYDQILK